MALGPGFAYAVHDPQRCFRSLMDAFARPGLVKPFDCALAPPAPLSPELAAVALSLADRDAPLWLDETLARSAEARAFLIFHTGARIADRPDEAAFALVTAPGLMPPLGDFAQGADAYPDRSTTVVLAVEGLAEGGPLVVTGPGVKGEARFSFAPLPDDLLLQLEENRARFPRGVDLLLVALGRVAALPRSCRVGESR